MVIKQKGIYKIRALCQFYDTNYSKFILLKLENSSSDRSKHTNTRDTKGVRQNGGL